MEDYPKLYGKVKISEAIRAHGSHAQRALDGEIVIIHPGTLKTNRNASPLFAVSPVRKIKGIQYACFTTRQVEMTEDTEIKLMALAEKMRSDTTRKDPLPSAYDVLVKPHIN
jgi:hypothetical protein